MRAARARTPWARERFVRTLRRSLWQKLLESTRGRPWPADVVCRKRTCSSTLVQVIEVALRADILECEELPAAKITKKERYVQVHQCTSADANQQHIE